MLKQFRYVPIWKKFDYAKMSHWDHSVIPMAHIFFLSTVFDCIFYLEAIQIKIILAFNLSIFTYRFNLVSEFKAILSGPRFSSCICYITFLQNLRQFYRPTKPVLAQSNFFQIGTSNKHPSLNRIPTSMVDVGLQAGKLTMCSSQ